MAHMYSVFSRKFIKVEMLRGGGGGGGEGDEAQRDGRNAKYAGEGVRPFLVVHPISQLSRRREVAYVL